MPRVFLTGPELATTKGAELLQLCLRITADGRLDLDEVKLLRRWLRENRNDDSAAAIEYLADIMERVTADGVVDKDEQLELILALEKVIPVAQRAPAQAARKKRQAARREREKERKRQERERQKLERGQEKEEEIRQARRIRHLYTKVAGVSFPNDDGTERQAIISKCVRGEWLELQHDAYNEYSISAIKILRSNGQQIGHVRNELAASVLDDVADGYRVFGIITDITGGTRDKPMRGVNYALLIVDPSVPESELARYFHERVW